MSITPNELRSIAAGQREIGRNPLGDAFDEAAARIAELQAELQAELRVRDLAGSAACGELAGGQPGWTSTASDIEWKQRVAAARAELAREEGTADSD